MVATVTRQIIWSGAKFYEECKQQNIVINKMHVNCKLEGRVVVMWWKSLIQSFSPSWFHHSQYKCGLKCGGKKIPIKQLLSDKLLNELPNLIDLLFKSSDMLCLLSVIHNEHSTDIYCLLWVISVTSTWHFKKITCPLTNPSNFLTAGGKILAGQWANKG